MADNYIGKLNSAGVTFASDDVGGVQHPRVKVEVGPDGSASDLVLGQTTKSASLPVTLASDQGALSVTDSSVAGLSKNSGTVDASTLRVITASDGPLNTAIGSTTDAAASSSVAEDTTARSHTGILKGIKNVLLLISAALTKGQSNKAGSLPVTVASDQGNISVDIAGASGLDRGVGVSSSSTLRIQMANNGTIATTLGIETNAASSSSVAEDTTAASHTSLLKGIKNVLLLVNTALAGYLKVGGAAATVTVTPTLTVHANYVTGDFVGTSSTAMTIAAGRVNDGTGVIQSAVLIDYALQSVTTELWLFDASVTPPADSAAWSISDADSLKCIGVIKFDTYFASALNSVAMGSFQPIAYKCASGTQNIYGCLVTRGAPTYASGDVSIRLVVLQD